MPKAIFTLHDGSRHTVEVALGETLMKAALAADIPGIAGECGGSGSCATCKIQIGDGWWDRLPPAEELEESLVEDAAPHTRLSCQLVMAADLDGIEVVVPQSQYG